MTITSYGQTGETVNSGCTQAWLCFGKTEIDSDTLTDTLTGLDSTVFQAEFDYLFLQRYTTYLVLYIFNKYWNRLYLPILR